VDVDITRYTDAGGQATWAARAQAVKLLVRKPGYRDAEVAVPAGTSTVAMALEPEADPAAPGR
jgi:hypothetical protein